MKLPGVLIATVASAISLTGCVLSQDPIDVTGPETYFPPHCSVVQLTMDSEILTSEYGGYVDLRLTVNNEGGGTPAYNLHAEIEVEVAHQWIGEAGIDLGTLEYDQSALAYIEVPVTRSPDGAFCTLTWDDDAGTQYSSVAEILWGDFSPATNLKGSLSPVP